MASYLRGLVSKQKRRFNQDGFDLDLTYITDNIVAMGFPAEHVEGIYRNKMADVVRFLDSRHGEHYKVYNLCSERSYDKSKFHGRVAHYPFEDHNAPPIELMQPFCADVHDWISRDAQNVAVVHCKAGKGRTGVMICAYLLHNGTWRSARESLLFYGEARTKNQKGVTIPSQLRYVHYYEVMLNNGFRYEPKTLFLSCVTLHSVPRFNKEGSCHPVFSVSVKNTQVFRSHSLVEHVAKEQAIIRIALQRPLPLCGDIKVQFFHKTSIGGKEKMFQFWFNTAFIEDYRLFLTKPELDKANKDKHHKLFDQNFAVELTFLTSNELLARPASTGEFGSGASTPTSPPQSTRTSRNLGSTMHTQLTQSSPNTLGVGFGSGTVAAGAGAASQTTSYGNLKASIQSLTHGDAFSVQTTGSDDDPFEYDAGEEEEIEEQRLQEETKNAT